MCFSVVQVVLLVMVLLGLGLDLVDFKIASDLLKHLVLADAPFL